MRRTRNPVYGSFVSRVRIPPLPPFFLSKAYGLSAVGFFRCGVAPELGDRGLNKGPKKRLSNDFKAFFLANFQKNRIMQSHIKTIKALVSAFIRFLTVGYGNACAAV